MSLPRAIFRSTGSANRIAKNINQGENGRRGDRGKNPGRMPTAEETPTVRCDLARWKPRPGDFREVAAVGRKSVYEPLRRSGLFVFVNIASSRSLSRSHREQRAGEMSNYRRGALPIYTNLSRSSDPDALFRALREDIRFVKETYRALMIRAQSYR